MMGRIVQRSTLMMSRGAMKQTLFASHIHHHRPVSLPTPNSLALFYSTTHSAQNQNSSAAADPIPANHANSSTTTNHTNTTTNTSNTSNEQSQQQQQEAEKVISIEELQRAAQKAQQEAKTRKEMENLLKTVIYRGARSIALFVLAFSAFFYVVKQKGSESRIVRYLEALRRTRGDHESENDEEQQLSEQEKVLKRQALEKTEQLKREMKDATWYMSDDSDDSDDSGDKKKKSGSASGSRIGDNIDTRAAKEQREVLMASNGKK